MTIRRSTVYMLAVTTALLAIANTVVFVHTWQTGGAVDSEPGSAWARWAALTVTERTAHVRQYEALSSTGEAATVLRRARDFACLSPREQQHQRQVLALATETLRAQPAARRNHWLRVSPQTRAYLIYRALLETDPERIARLREQWAAVPSES